MKYVIALSLLLAGCTAIKQHHVGALDRKTYTGTISHNIIVRYIPDVRAICGAYQACAIGTSVYMPEADGWEGVQHYTLTWDFSGSDFVAMEGNQITGKAWPRAEDFAIVLAHALNLPKHDYQYQRLLAHEIMHTFGMVD